MEIKVKLQDLIDAVYFIENVPQASVDVRVVVDTGHLMLCNSDFKIKIPVAHSEMKARIIEDKPLPQTRNK